MFTKPYDYLSFSLSNMKYTPIPWSGTRWVYKSHSHCDGICLQSFNTLRPRQNGRHFADDILKCIFVNENVWKPIEISLKFVPHGPINNIPALVQIMAWRRPGDKPLSGPMMVRLPTHICVTRPQWVNYPRSPVVCMRRPCFIHDQADTANSAKWNCPVAIISLSYATDTLIENYPFT